MTEGRALGVEHLRMIVGPECPCSYSLFYREYKVFQTSIRGPASACYNKQVLGALPLIRRPFSAPDYRYPPLYI
jgi:hypothetical protein